MNKPQSGIYLQYGCGYTVGKGWENYDNSPTMRLSRLPAIGGLAQKLFGTNFPREVQYGDVCKGLIVPANSCQGIYASHVLEHLALDDFYTALKNTYEMLAPGGIFRLVVPDLQARAELYLKKLNEPDSIGSQLLMASTHLGQRQRPRSFMQRLRNQFGNSAHLWMWDEIAMKKALEETGFTNVRRCRFGDCGDPMFAKVESESRFFDGHYNVAELAMEARKKNI